MNALFASSPGRHRRPVLPRNQQKRTRDRPRVTRRKQTGTVLPTVPSDVEKYSYFGKQYKWPFIWLFFGQCAIIYAFVMVAKRSYYTMPLLVFLAVLVPPVVVNLWLRLRNHRESLDEHVARVLAWQIASRRPSVDVMLPVCGEPPDVVENTWKAVKRLNYGGEIRVHVLDDAALPWVRELADDYGFDYVVRPNRGELKKAGNLIHAFDRTDGDFILVLDADFAPRADFMDETLPYFDDATVGVVQTSQFFDTAGVNFIAKCSGTLQNLFFHWIQPARDTYEAAICAGTNVVYRRRAVEDAGGFARVPIGEDVHSGVKLWAKGWHTRYVRLNLAKGVAPDTFAGIVNQQVRWCRSSMLLMINRNFTVAPFSLKQRVCFWAAFIYYMQSAAVLLTLPTPTMVMLWAYPDQVRWWYYIPIVPGLISSLLVFPKLSKGWTPAIFRVTIIYSICHLLAITHAFKGIVQAWVPTGAATRKADLPRQAMRILRVWTVIVQSSVWLALARVVHLGLNLWVFTPVILLAIWQLILIVPVLVERDEDGTADIPRAVDNAFPALVPEGALNES